MIITPQLAVKLCVTAPSKLHCGAKYPKRVVRKNQVIRQNARLDPQLPESGPNSLRQRDLRPRRVVAKAARRNKSMSRLRRSA